jgi:hypothetical protein
MSLQARFAVVALSGAVATFTGLSAAPAQDAVTYEFGDWKVTIQPGRGTSPAATSGPIRLASQVQGGENPIPPSPASAETAPLPQETAAGAADPKDRVRLYSQIYNSIPFSRAEYAANPSYRHDATMELLFGQMRPTVIQRGTTMIRNRNPAMSLPYPAYSPYGFNSFFFPFYYGYGGFHAPYSLW